MPRSEPAKHVTPSISTGFSLWEGQPMFTSILWLFLIAVGRDRRN
jgi:hypothetical protein